MISNEPSRGAPEEAFTSNVDAHHIHLRSREEANVRDGHSHCRRALRSDEAAVQHSDRRGSCHEQEDMDRPMEDHAGHRGQVEESGNGRVGSSRPGAQEIYDDSHLDEGCSHEEVVHHDDHHNVHHLLEDSRRSYDVVGSESERGRRHPNGESLTEAAKRKNSFLRGVIVSTHIRYAVDISTFEFSII